MIYIREQPESEIEKLERQNTENICFFVFHLFFLREKTKKKHMALLV